MHRTGSVLTIGRIQLIVYNRNRKPAHSGFGQKDKPIGLNASSKAFGETIAT